jgi:hypothetical protein
MSSSAAARNFVLAFLLLLYYNTIVTPTDGKNPRKSSGAF